MNVGDHRFTPTDGRPSSLIVLLHGVGSSASSMAPLAQFLSRSIPAAAVVALNGPEDFDGGNGGHQWFSIRGVTDGNRKARVFAALPRLERMIAAEQERLGINAPNTVVVGFSQGAIMALQLAASSKIPPAAIVSLAGRIALPFAVSAGRHPVVLLSHGSADSVISPTELDRAALELRAHGIEVQTQVVAGHGHSIHADQARRVVEFVSTILASGLREVA